MRSGNRFEAELPSAGVVEAAVFFQGVLFLVFSEGVDFLGECVVGECEYLDGEDGGVFCAGFSDSHACDGYAGGHLDGAEQCVESGGAFCGGERDTDDGQRCSCGECSGEVGGHAGGGYDDFCAVISGVLGEFGGGFGGAMRGEYADGRVDTEAFELIDAGLHCRQVAVGAHYYCYGCVFCWSRHCVFPIRHYIIGYRESHGQDAHSTGVHGQDAHATGWDDSVELRGLQVSRENL